jgi:hypothetical protein
MAMVLPTETPPLLRMDRVNLAWWYMLKIPATGKDHGLRLTGAKSYQESPLTNKPGLFVHTYSYTEGIDKRNLAWGIKLERRSYPKEK